MTGVDSSQWRVGEKTLLIRPSGASQCKALDFRTKDLALILEAVGAREDCGKRLT